MCKNITREKKHPALIANIKNRHSQENNSRLTSSYMASGQYLKPMCKERPEIEGGGNLPHANKFIRCLFTLNDGVMKALH